MTAREEERKRLRRDLHDGVGPSLAGILLKLQAAQSRRDDGERNAILTEIRKETRGAITRGSPGSSESACRRRRSTRSAWSVRSASGVRPSRPTRWSTRSTEPDQLRSLPAAVEVAAFRIASEAMTNVARRLGASRCRIDVELDVTLGLTVSDNGHGSSGAHDFRRRLDIHDRTRRRAGRLVHDLQPPRRRTRHTSRPPTFASST